MKNVLALSLIFLSVTSTVKSQTSLSSISLNFTAEKLKQIEFIDHISFTPSTTKKQSTREYYWGNGQDLSAVITTESSPSDATEKVNATQVKYAMMMDVDIESLTNLTLYKFIEEWFGTRYRMGGKTKKGIDCSAFTGTLLLAVYSLAVPRTAKLQYKLCEHICKEDLLEGDLVFFNTKGGVSHVGVYLSNGHFVHSASSKGVMVSSLDDRYFAKKFIGGGRVN